MAAALTDLFAKASNGVAPVPTTLSAQKLTGAASATITLATGWPTDTAIHFILYQVDANNAMVAGTETLWKGILSGTTISSLTLRSGTDTTYAAGSVVQMAPTSAWADDFVTGMIAEHNQLGIHQKINGNTVPAGTDTVTLNTASQTLTNKTLTSPTISTPTITTRFDGWTTSLPTPNTVTYNGNRSYSLVFNSTDLTSYISNGMRLKLTRTVTAPTQCTSLNGTTQFYNRASASVTGMTFTNNFVVSAWVKLSSYPASAGTIASRYNGTSGWRMSVQSTGQVQLDGFNAGSANFSLVISYQSIPLNKWVHVTAQLDMLTFTATSTTSYVMIDGQDVPASVSRGGTNPTALIQAGNLEIGSQNGGLLPFPGKIAQAAVFSAKVTQATIQSYISQGLAGTETSLISAYSFNNSINDLNANANNLTANGSAVATTLDSPFAQDDTGTPTGSTDCGIITSKVFSTNTTLTVQVPEGCTIPTSGGVSAVSYSTQKTPYGFPGSRDRWIIRLLGKTTATQSSPVSGTWYNPNSQQISIPVGAWDTTWEATIWATKAATTDIGVLATLSTANNSESDPELTAATRIDHSTAGTLRAWTTFNRRKSLNITSITPYFLNVMTRDTSATDLNVDGTNTNAGGTTVIMAELAYL